MKRLMAAVGILLLLTPHAPHLTPHCFAAEVLTEKDLKFDMAYYQRKFRRLSPNDRLFMLQQIRKKYANLGFNLSSVDDEIAFLAAARGSPGPSSAGDVSDQRHVIESGDQLDIAVFPQSELNRELTVQPDGSISLSMLGSVKVAGFTVSDLSERIRTGLSRYLVNPKVWVSVKKYARGGKQVSILGQVRSPGVYDYYEGMRVLEIISKTGGFTDDARRTKVELSRSVGGKKEITYLNLAKAVSRSEDDTYLKSGDRLFVPKRRLAAANYWPGQISPWVSFGTFVLTILLTARVVR